MTERINIYNILYFPDFDGWTPLHAAAHWAQKEACEILCENYCNMEIKNHVGQTAFDVADPDLVPQLNELKKKQANMQKDRPDITSLINRPAVPSITNTSSKPSNRRYVKLSDDGAFYSFNYSQVRIFRRCFYVKLFLAPIVIGVSGVFITVNSYWSFHPPLNVLLALVLILAENQELVISFWHVWLLDTIFCTLYLLIFFWNLIHYKYTI